MACRCQEGPAVDAAGETIGDQGLDHEPADSPDAGAVDDAGADGVEAGDADTMIDSRIDAGEWSPDGCDYWMVGSDGCEGREYGHPEMPHRDCGPDARELYLPQQLRSSGGAAEDALSVWGNHAFVLEGIRVTAMNLETGERRTILCDDTGVGTVSMTQFGVAGVLNRSTAAWEACPWRYDYLLFDWDSLSPRLLHSDYDLPGPTGIPCEGGLDQWDIDAYGDLVAVVASDHDCIPAVFTLDLRTGEWTRRVRLRPTLGWVSIWGRRVAYAAGEVYVLDLDTGDTLRLTDDSYGQESVDIWEDQVVWMDWRDGGRDIYRHDLTTGETSRVNRRADGLGNPRVFNGRVVFQGVNEDWLPVGSTRIWTFDILSGEERQVTFLPGHQFIEDVWEDKVYFSYMPDDGDARPTLCELTLEPR
ncbi:MAG: hypothetical protein JXB32_08390 [Deltaproteobacteria bacterium]|nr:hypothetical protein [Deltaproteobacteria bacterium]